MFYILHCKYSGYREVEEGEWVLILLKLLTLGQMKESLLMIESSKYKTDKWRCYFKW